MSNPWLKKNPAMSLWLSGANAVAGSLRGHAMAQARRGSATAVQDAVDFWTAALAPPAAPKKRKARKRR